MPFLRCAVEAKRNFQLGLLKAPAKFRRNIKSLVARHPIGLDVICGSQLRTESAAGETALREAYGRPGE